MHTPPTHIHRGTHMSFLKGLWFHVIKHFQKCSEDVQTLPSVFGARALNGVSIWLPGQPLWRQNHVSGWMCSIRMAEKSCQLAVQCFHLCLWGGICACYVPDKQAHMCLDRTYVSEGAGFVITVVWVPSFLSFLQAAYENKAVSRFFKEGIWSNSTWKSFRIFWSVKTISQSVLCSFFFFCKLVSKLAIGPDIPELVAPYTWSRVSSPISCLSAASQRCPLLLPPMSRETTLHISPVEWNKVFI